MNRFASAVTQVARRPRDFLGVRGPDAASYLQAMVSNDVEALDIGGSCEALLLTPKARVIAPLVVLDRRERHVRGEALLGMRDDEASSGLR